jgi:DNA-binding GntR family transcriptional regulator
MYEKGDMGAAMGKARHEDIARDLAQEIADGRFVVGSLLPTELELCSLYDTSRYTVRMALGELQGLGLISRRKNVGTRVEATKPSAGFTLSSASIEDIAHFGPKHVRVLRGIQEVVVDVVLAEELGCKAGTRWLCISYLRMDVKTRRTPLGWTDVYVDSGYSDIGDMVRAAPEILISSLIETRYGRRIAQIQQDVKPTAVTAAIATELDVDNGAMALRVVRRYVDAADTAFEISVTVHPVDRFAFSFQLNRSRD